ncbi:MAG TPA: hypothetical protein VHK27_15305 [Gammaproteobacteria bacterium]|nr:hypothetical protein [Gammaproteobacteria bacterium]
MNKDDQIVQDLYQIYLRPGITIKETFELMAEYVRSCEEAKDMIIKQWHDACDDVGVPRDPKALIRHHRGSAAFITALDLKANVEYRHKCTFFMDDSAPVNYSAADCDCAAEPGDDEKRFITDWK